MLYGWDASDFDHNRGMRARHIRAAYREGIRFFTHKITEGTTTIHYRAGEKVRAADKAGIPFLGFYVVTRTPGNGANGSVSAQVNYAIKQADKQWPTWRKHKGFFWQVDLEHWSYDKVSPRHGNEMCRLLESRTGKKAVLYAPKWAYGNSIGGRYPLWASNYNGSGSAANFKTQWNRTRKSSHPGWGRYSGRKPVILQYASDATIGKQRTCDANVFDGNADAFAKMINGKATASSTRLSSKEIQAAAKAVGREVHKDGWIKAPHQSSTLASNPSWALHTAVEKILGDVHYDTPAQLDAHNDILDTIREQLTAIDDSLDRLRERRGDGNS